MLATKSGLKLFEAMQEASTVSYWAQFGNRWKVAQMVISMAIIKEKCWPGTCSRGLCFRIDTLHGRSLGAEVGVLLTANF